MRSLVRRTIASATALSISIALAAPAMADVGVTVNGDAVGFSPAPIVRAGRVFVPLRGVFERLGASVVYDAGTINATGNGRDISLHIGDTRATVNGQNEIIDVAPYILGASTYVPLRFVSEALGATVNYDASDDQVAITTDSGAPSYAAPATNNDEDNATYASYAPPAIPTYAQPDVSVQDDIWQPGYWAFGADGYYWVPGTWAEPPQVGDLWTPGYWSADANTYAWHPGYWGNTVGFYGGVDYGYGYDGHGYNGGRWQHDTFIYNTYVTHVNRTVVHKVYIDDKVAVDHNVTRVGYSGGTNEPRVHPVAFAPPVRVAPIRITPVVEAPIAYTRPIAEPVRVVAPTPRLAPTVRAPDFRLAPDRPEIVNRPVQAQVLVSPPKADTQRPDRRREAR